VSSIFTKKLKRASVFATFAELGKSIKTLKQVFKILKRYRYTCKNVKYKNT